jgi:DNA-binding SARP family transcriptional activator/tetratricopeptide (TPR) repeat protein
MDFRILGPLVALDGDRDVAPQRAKPRALLGLLLLHANQRVSTDRIIEALWGETPPNTADTALHGHISTIRKLLGSDRIHTERSGYRLEVAPGELDLDRFAAAIAAARASPDPGERSRQLGGALALWRGEPLVDVQGESFAPSDVARIEALQLAAVEERGEAELELGRHAELIPDLELALAQHPLSEGLRAKLMVALYRSGRQSEALRVYHAGRRLLAEELGIEPGSELRLLEQRILDQDPVLAAPAVRERSPVRQERKIVSLLVIEVVATRSVDPEDLERFVGPAISQVRAVVERLGGATETLFANAVLGIFGAPRAHDDDPARAASAALELVAMVLEPPMQLRGGIETGEALVTIDGGRIAITGEVLGAASHLQAGAPIGSIAIGAGTHRLTDAAIEYRSIGPNAWAPEAVRKGPGSAVPDAPLIGRVDELALLERIYARARDERSVQLATVTAEPGGGKTRLISELRLLLEAADEPPTWRQGRCLPYGDGVTYWALGEIIKAQVGIDESDDSEATLRKLRASVVELEPDEARRTWFERSLAALLGLEGAVGSGDRQQAFGVWRAFIEAIAAQRPLVVVFEDIHWADAALLEFIDDLVEHASGVQLLVLCTARLELLGANPGWGGGKRNATMIALEPLSSPDTERLLSALLGRAPNSTTIRRAGGNPLYAHELARVVGASGSEESTAIPESLQAVIAAHLDTLTPEVKAVASDAAVVGEVFWSGAVAAMTGLDEREVELRLHRLVSNDVARRRRSSSVAHQTEYAFLHVLVRDVAYGQIPRRDRIGRHRAAAEWIEQLAGDRVVDHAELIAHHYLQSLELAQGLGDLAQARELRPRALTFLMLAGDRARPLDVAQAESLYRRALELTPEGDPARGRLLSRLGEVAQFTGRLAEAEQLLEAAIADLKAHGDLLGAGEAMVTLVVALWRLGRSDAERRGLAADAIRILEQLPPGRELVQAYARMATHELHAGRAGACRDWSLKALALAERLGAGALKQQPLLHLGIGRFESGDLGGIDDIRQAWQLGLETGLGWETGTAQSNLGATVWVTAGPAAGLALKRAAAEFASSRGLRYLERTIRAEMLWLLFDAGNWDELLQSADELIAWDREHGESRITMFAQTTKAKVLSARGRNREASAVEKEYLARARKLGDPQDSVPALATAALVHLSRGDGAGAIALITELEERTRGSDVSRRVNELPFVARIGAALGVPEIAEALLPEGTGPVFARGQHCVASGKAVLAEARGDLAAAELLFSEAAAGWTAFGDPAEEAHALLGLGRCLIALGQPVVGLERLREARGIGRKLGARPLVEAADRLISAVG